MEEVRTIFQQRPKQQHCRSEGQKRRILEDEAASHLSSLILIEVLGTYEAALNTRRDT